MFNLGKIRTKEIKGRVRLKSLFGKEGNTDKGERGSGGAFRILREVTKKKEKKRGKY